ncbi:hypothetical protein HYZ64_00540 [Candidatus Berkelbacteria bacterium]|nr:hypothetical protein [Candidatus Berkelbacteria bacterium]
MRSLAEIHTEVRKEFNKAAQLEEMLIAMFELLKTLGITSPGGFQLGMPMQKLADQVVFPCEVCWIDPFSTPQNQRLEGRVIFSEFPPSGEDVVLHGTLPLLIWHRKALRAARLNVPENCLVVWRFLSDSECFGIPARVFIETLTMTKAKVTVDFEKANAGYRGIVSLSFESDVL